MTAPASPRSAARILDDFLVAVAGLVNRAKIDLAAGTGLCGADLGVPTEAECERVDAAMRRAKPAPAKVVPPPPAPALSPVTPPPDLVSNPRACTAYAKGFRAGRAGEPEPVYLPRGAGVWLGRACHRGYEAGAASKGA